jgi:regulator of sigma E protease
MPLPRGVTVTAIADQPVQNWQDMIALKDQKKGLQVEITYRSSEDQSLQTLSITVPDNEDWIGFAYVPDLGDLLDLPLTPMKKTFKGENWFESLGMGLDRTYVFAAQTYLMLRGMVKGTVSPKSASGPVGILKMSYTIVEQKSYIFYFYFMAMINICIAVFNFLPLPILDGGHFVLLIVEKVKGSPVSIKVQEVISYAGLVLILGFVLFVTYYDIVKLATGQL